MISHIGWMMDKPLSKASYGYDENDKPIPIPDEVLKIPLKIRRNDRVGLVWNEGEAILTAPLRGKTVKDFLKCIESGMKSKIELSEAENIYKVVGTFFRSEDRLRLITAFEKGKLTPGEIIHDNYCFFEGNIKRERNGIWIYGVGS